MKKIKVRKFSSKKYLIIVIGLCLLGASLTFSLARFVYTKVLDFYFSSKHFYFESDKLTVKEASYLLDHWNGVDPYNIVINVNSFKNNSLKSNTDISYNISYNCSSTVICDSNKNSGIIYSSSNTDSFIVTMTPNATFKDNDSVTMEIMAETTKPYKKKLSAQFKFVVGVYGLGHEITDSSGSPYLEVKVTNTLNYYTVREAFDNYNVNDRIDEATYSNLSEMNKAKCVSAKINFEFNPNTVYVDNNSTSFLNSYDRKSIMIDKYEYVSNFSFDMESSSSTIIRLYKRDASKDYSNNSDVVTVSYEF